MALERADLVGSLQQRGYHANQGLFGHRVVPAETVAIYDGSLLDCRLKVLFEFEGENSVNEDGWRQLLRGYKKQG